MSEQTTDIRIHHHVELNAFPGRNVPKEVTAPGHNLQIMRMKLIQTEDLSTDVHTEDPSSMGAKFSV